MRNSRLIGATLILLLQTLVLPLQTGNATPVGTGLSLYYKSDATWTRPPAPFTTSTCHTATGNLDFNWGGGSPGGSCPSDYFTGYGVGYILAPVTGTVTFCDQADDQFYLKIDSNLIIDDNTAKAAATGQSCNGTGSMSMVAGNSYSIESWVHEQGGGAEWRLLWSYPGQSSYVIVPVANLNATTFTVADTTPPTFTSSATFSASENIAATATAATIRISESATVTISAGVDASSFNIYFSDSTTALVKFKVPPDYEAPIDSGSNNVYNLTLLAIDGSANSATQAITITVTDVVDTSGFNSFALAGSVTTATFRTTIQLTANVTVAAKVTFRANNIRIPGCINVRTTGTSPSIVAICNWKPSRRGPLTLTAAATPTGAGISSASATPIRVLVGNRTGTR